MTTLLVASLIAAQSVLAVTRVTEVTLPSPMPKGFKGPSERKGSAVFAKKKISADIGRVVLDNTLYTVTLIGPYEVEFATDESLIVHSGKALIKTKGKKLNDFRPLVKTPSVTMGVRGTEFMASHTTLLGESEIVTFESDVQLSENSGGKKQIISQGHWGGKGGRFGETLVKPIKLPDHVLGYFKSLFKK